ncbi:hypothetical protein TUBRATIS_16820 [Tubulinosema ratisbonensis]|uniref:Uncharacterized protein n=1 Tax=Tubulinosema ratisbonensis TaxID=291195 RepID=A0A437ALA9_9MICR|nr:hypothetical protein TUBRATIS_16820 [Tubulinosema ratisbonensis]
MLTKKYKIIKLLFILKSNQIFFIYFFIDLRLNTFDQKCKFVSQTNDVFCITSIIPHPIGSVLTYLIEFRFAEAMAEVAFYLKNFCRN